MKDNELLIVEPKQCANCRWKPAIQNNKAQKISTEKKWLIIPIPQSVVWLFICPQCNIAMANDNCVENVKNLLEMKNKKIITPNSDVVKPELSLLPKKNIFTKN